MPGTQTSTDERACWLALNRTPGLGPARTVALLERYGGAREVVGAGSGALGQAGVPSSGLAFLGASDWPGVEQDLRWLDHPDRHLLTWSDAAYPALLKSIAGAPAMLFIEGSVEALARAQLALVGSRSPTPAARQTAYEFAAELARRGLTITSGLALGIDAASHRGAVAVDGFTLAVLGCGPDRVYPASHRRLAGEVAEHGALVSEFPVGTAPRAEHFPRRNRIIAGLSIGVLVVEAALRSGSLITARLAMEQGREVLAMPGSIHNPLARGCHALIRQGAKLVETVDDVLEEIGPQLGVAPGPATAATPSETAFGLDEEYQHLLELVGYDATSVDTLVRHSGLTAQAVSSMLLQLELSGFVSSIAGGLYTRTPRKQ